MLDCWSLRDACDADSSDENRRRFLNSATTFPIVSGWSDIRKLGRSFGICSRAVGKCLGFAPGRMRVPRAK
jgi:hypothetical protein